MAVPQIWHWCLVFAYGWLFALVVGACPFDDPNAPRWSPLGTESYLSVSFADPRGTTPFPGLIYHSKPGQAVQAPEDGAIIELREAKDGSGKELLFRGVTGHIWLYGNLQSVGTKRTGLKEYEPIGKASNTFRMELHDPTGNQTINPCEVGLACYDSVPPHVLRAVTWDATNVRSSMRFTGKEALASGCLEVDPQFSEPRLAFQLVDYATLPARDRMGVYSISLRQGSSLYYSREVRTYALPVEQVFVEEYLQSFSADTLGFWYSLAPSATPNENQHGTPEELGQVLRQVVAASDVKANNQFLKLELKDHRLNTTLLRLVPRPSCAPHTPIPAPSAKDSLLYTFLSRPWLQMSVCAQGVKVSLLDSNMQIVERSLCDSIAHEPITVMSLLGRYPSARTVIFGGSLVQSRSVMIMPLMPQLLWKQEGLTLAVKVAKPHFENALAWEVVSGQNGTKTVRTVHPQGIRMRWQATDD